MKNGQIDVKQRPATSGKTSKKHKKSKTTTPKS